MNLIVCMTLLVMAMPKICLAQCPADLGRTYERLPNSDVNAFLQQEVPNNTAFATCPYTAGGLDVTYPTSWFSQSPSVRITIQPSTFDPQTQYFAEISSNNVGSATIKVTKYTTSSLCTQACYGGQCANTPTCQGTCTSSDAVSCATNCAGSCSTSCTCDSIASNTCSSACQSCNGTCNGSCSAISANSSCVGYTTIPIQSLIPAATYNFQCDGVCSNCANLAACPAPGVFLGSQCTGVCTNCISATNSLGTCQGILTTGATMPADNSSRTLECDGISSACKGTCTGTGACTGTLIGNCENNAVCSNCAGIGLGAGTCLSTSSFRGQCSVMDGGLCLGVCSECLGAGVCTGISMAQQCTGSCASCTGSCQGTPTLLTPSNACSTTFGTVTGYCNVPASNSNWSGQCSDCDGTCTGNGTWLGATCQATNVAQQAIEVAAGEVTVNFYAIEQ